MPRSTDQVPITARPAARWLLLVVGGLAFVVVALTWRGSLDEPFTVIGEVTSNGEGGVCIDGFEGGDPEQRFVSCLAPAEATRTLEPGDCVRVVVATPTLQPVEVERIPCSIDR